jgi:hypothetical protein
MLLVIAQPENTILLTMASHGAGITEMCPTTDVLVRWDLITLLPGLASNCKSPDLQLLGGWIIISTGHHTQPVAIF